MKKKLMLISPMLHQGGFERVCVTTARLLAPYFEVVIVIFSSEDIAYDIKGLNIIDIKMGAREGMAGKLLNIGKRSLKVRQLKKRWKPDIAYSFGSTANIVNAFSRTGKEKVWLGIRSYMEMGQPRKIRLLAKFADVLVCCSRKIEGELGEKYGICHTATLYNPYNVEAIRKEGDSGEPALPWGERDGQGRKLEVLVSMGREDQVKGFWHLLKAFALVHETIPQARLLIIGEGTFEPYKKLAEELKIDGEVYFSGLQREPYKYLKTGQVYLLTSLNEGFPNALVEGMALGLAAVSTACMTGPSEILQEKDDISLFRQQAAENSPPVIYGDYGILVPVMAPEPDFDPGHILEEERNLAQVVAGLLLDRQQLEKYQKAAVERSRIFTYEGYVGQFLKCAGLPGRKKERG